MKASQTCASQPRGTYPRGDATVGAPTSVGFLNDLNDRLGTVTARAFDLAERLTAFNNSVLGTAPDCDEVAGNDCVPGGRVHEAIARCDTLAQALDRIERQVIRTAIL